MLFEDLVDFLILPELEHLYAAFIVVECVQMASI